MKQFNGYKAEKAMEREQLPVGGYVVKLLNAEVVTYQGRNGDFERFEISFDIAEGPHAGFFRKDYEAQQREDKKWFGKLALYIPADDGSEKDEWTKRAFNNVMYCIEDSNPGYHWDWNEAGLKGKTVGALFRREEWERDGKFGWSTRCCAFATAEDIRSGSFRMPKDKPLKNRPQAALPQSFDPIPDDTKLPWDD